MEWIKVISEAQRTSDYSKPHTRTHLPFTNSLYLSALGDVMTTVRGPPVNCVGGALPSISNQVLGS